MTDLAVVLDAVDTWLMAAIFVFMRVAAAVVMLPAFGEMVVPARVKLGLALAFTVVLVPLVPEPLTPQSPIELLALAGSEIANGLFWGLLLRCFIFALETAGAIAAQSMSLSQLFGGVSADPLPAFGKLWVMGGLAFATIMGLHTQFAAYLLASYDIVPVGRLAAAEDVLTLGLEQIGRCFALAFSLAAPMMVASLLYNLTLGFINRAMPQLMVSFVGAPAITAGGLLLLLLTTPMVLGLWFDHILGFLEATR